MHSLPIFLRLAGRPVILVGEGEAADAKRRLLERAGAAIVDEGAQATLAIVALDDDDAAAAAAARLRARGVLVNAVDRPGLCDFTLPAIVDRDPVLVAVGTGGASAGLAKTLRQRLETLLPASLGALAARLFERRPDISARWPDAANRRRAIDAALDGPLDPLADQRPDAVDRWLAEPLRAAPGEVHRLRLGSADPDDLTLRQARLLASADVVHHGDDVPPAILARARADATRIAAPFTGDATEGIVVEVRMERP